MSSDTLPAGASPEAARRPRSRTFGPEDLRDRVVELRRVSARELRENPGRWREHPSGQRRALGELLARIGIAATLVARVAEDGSLVLLDGHLRKDIAPDAILPVAVVDLDEEEAEIFLASFDPVGQMASASHEALARLVASTPLPRDLLQDLRLRYPGDRRAACTDPDAIPGSPRTSRVRSGELWALGDHRLACGDATQPEAVAGLVGAEQIDVVFTDPPYGVGYVGKTKRALMIENDGADGLQSLLERSFSAVDQVLAPGARLYVCHPAGPHAATFAAAFIGTGWRLHQTLVWVKDRIVLGHSDYHYRHEPILYGYKPGPGRWGRGQQGWYGGNDADSVLEVARPAASREHPTAKPVELISRCLANSSAPGGCSTRSRDPARR